MIPSSIPLSFGMFHSCCNVSYATERRSRTRTALVLSVLFGVLLGGPFAHHHEDEHAEGYDHDCIECVCCSGPRLHASDAGPVVPVEAPSPVLRLFIDSEPAPPSPRRQHRYDLWRPPPIA